MTRLKRTLTLLLCAVFAINLCLPVSAISEKKLISAVNKSAEYMLNAVKHPQVGSIGGEWAVIGLARSGYDVP